MAITLIDDRSFNPLAIRFVPQLRLRLGVANHVAITGGGSRKGSSSLPVDSSDA
jgi:hypothetical protein